jgi:hypothetical protein
MQTLIHRVFVVAQIKRQRSFNMTQSPHARYASVRERTDAQKGPAMK